MYCTKCGNALRVASNFCTRCGTRVANEIVVDRTENTGSKLWKRFKQAVAMQLQIEAAKAVMQQQQQQQSGDNFWSSTTACGNDNSQSGYVDVGGTIVGYDR